MVAIAYEAFLLLLICLWGAFTCCRVNQRFAPRVADRARLPHYCRRSTNSASTKIFIKFTASSIQAKKPQTAGGRRRRAWLTSSLDQHPQRTRATNATTSNPKDSGANFQEAVSSDPLPQRNSPNIIYFLCSGHGWLLSTTQRNTRFCRRRTKCLPPQR